MNNSNLHEQGKEPELKNANEKEKPSDGAQSDGAQSEKPLTDAEREQAEWTAPGFLIVSLSPADILTLTALLMCTISMLLVIHGKLYLGMSVLLIAMLFDAFDGIVARKYGWESPFGRYLDGFVDAFNYLALPSVILWSMGLARPGFYGVLQLGVFFVFTALGIMRLSVFNVIGNIKVCGGRAYLGLPVFWSQFLVALLFLLKGVVSLSVWTIVTNLSLLIMGGCFLINRPFWKPKNLLLIVGVIGALAGVFAWIGIGKL
jgi:CDP-diacylglycerol--serine O-phosphatidyltransferase